jgi:protein TonB
MRDHAINDRFLVALLIAGIVHAILILGVSFETPKPDRVKRSLAVTLVQQPSRTPPKAAEHLAQEHQVSSGLGQKKVVPRAQPVPEVRQPPKPRPEPVPTPPVQTPATEAKRKPVLVQPKAEKAVPVDHGQAEHPEAQPRKLDLGSLSQQIAAVSTELNLARETQAQGLRKVFINSVNAHKYKAAAYERSWQQKIERVGNLNYPDEARRQKLSGSLVLTVGLRQDGTVYSIKVSHSSGHAVLDDAAKRIVELAAPFGPLPPELRQEVDVLMITRTWRFYNDSRMETQ